ALPGIFHEDTTRRVYPSGRLAASVVGFVGRDGNGLGGLAPGDNSVLAGVNGVDTYQSAAGNQIATAGSSERAAVDGSTVRLTIARDLRWRAECALAAQVKCARADSGTVVVMDPPSGAILALATYPGFDP